MRNIILLVLFLLSTSFEVRESNNIIDYFRIRDGKVLIGLKNTKIRKSTKKIDICKRVRNDSIGNYFMFDDEKYYLDSNLWATCKYNLDSIATQVYRSFLPSISYDCQIMFNMDLILFINKEGLITYKGTRFGHVKNTCFDSIQSEILENINFKFTPMQQNTSSIASITQYQLRLQ